MQAGDNAAAAGLFARACVADPAAPALWLNLATARRALGDDEAERAALLGALSADQRHFMSLVRLAELHERLGEEGGAVARWQAVLSLAAMLAERPPAIEPMLAHARAYVDARTAAFAAAIDDGLAPHRADLGLRDLRRVNACVAAATGRRRIYRNECEGIHFPFLPADEFFDREHFPWMPLLEDHADAIRAEVMALIADGVPGIRPYVAMAPGTPPNKWSALDHSLDWGAWYLWRFGVRQEAACARAPVTARVLEQLPLADMPGRGPTAFFSLLRPRTRLPAHTGVSNLRAIVHLPLIVPPGCGFRVGGETREWKVGEAFAFDDTIEHEAWNDSDELRAILIFDVWNPHLTPIERSLMRQFFAVADASGYNPGGSTAVSD